jgi:Ca-activated chloride channel homolog
LTQLFSQRPAEDASSYNLRLPVNEIELTFRAFEANGVPLLHLTSDNLHLWDNGKRQTRVAMLAPYENLPIKAGFVIDVSTSMSQHFDDDRAIVQLYATGLFRKGIDRGFLMQFDTLAVMLQDWTGNPSDLLATAKGNGRTPPGHLPLTSLYDSLYTACREQWPVDSGSMTGNFILLFSDGVDDDSRAYLSEAVDMCQRKRVTIYAITFDGRSPFSSGQRNLEELARETGGRVFFAPRGQKLLDDLRSIEAEQRNQYRLVYKPSNFKSDGTFHQVKLKCSVKGAKIMTRSGYYALARR